MCTIKLKRAYDAPEATDGFRIFVEMIWPRGLSHARFHYNLWEKAIAPSSELREWFLSDPSSRWPEFEERYKAELQQSRLFAKFKELVMQRPVVTLLYASRDRGRNNATVIYETLTAPALQTE